MLMTLHFEHMCKNNIRCISCNELKEPLMKMIVYGFTAHRETKGANYLHIAK